MCGKGFLKRAVPFLLTFVIGALIAGLFVPFGSFKFRKNNWHRHQEYHQKMETENQLLRDENERLKKQLSEIKVQDRSEELDVPPPLPLPPSKVKKVDVKVERITGVGIR